MISRLIMLFCIAILSNSYVCYKYEGFLSLLNFNFSFWIFRVVYFAVVALFFVTIFYQDVFFTYEPLGTLLTYFTTVYLGIFMLSLTLFACFDIAFLLSRAIPTLSPVVRVMYAGGLTVLLISLLVTGYGIWNAREISLKKYEITIPKSAHIESLRLVLLGDIHLGTSIKEKELADIVSRINELSPDIVVLGGDFIDHSTTAGLRETGAAILSGLKTRYGVYYVFGNHEYYLGDEYEASAQVRAVTELLDDKAVLIDEAFYLVGRFDPTNSKRKTTAEIVEGLDMSKPVILVEHQPNDISANINSGVDLQFSGHTHSGQLFPFNILVKVFNGLFYGHYIIDGYQAIVTSGTGVWGFPIRVGSKSEIVVADIYFNTEKP